MLLVAAAAGSEAPVTTAALGQLPKAAEMELGGENDDAVAKVNAGQVGGEVAGEGVSLVVCGRNTS